MNEKGNNTKLECEVLAFARQERGQRGWGKAEANRQWPRIFLELVKNTSSDAQSVPKRRNKRCCVQFSMRVLHSSHNPGAEVSGYPQTALQAFGQEAGWTNPGAESFSASFMPRADTCLPSPHTGAPELIRSRILLRWLDHTVNPLRS